MILIDIKNDQQWNWITAYCCNHPNFDFVDLNILYKGKELEDFMEYHQDSFVCRLTERDKRMYYTGEFLRFRLSENFRKFLATFNLKKFDSFCLEDPSFNNGKVDYLSIINHEDALIIDENLLDVSEFQKYGFDLSNHFKGFYN
jgi:hypothetical protein